MSCDTKECPIPNDRKSPGEVMDLCRRCLLFKNWPEHDDFNAYDTKELRETTGADITVCREALRLFGVDGAKDALREAGYAVRRICKSFQPM